MWRRLGVCILGVAVAACTAQAEGTVVEIPTSGPSGTDAQPTPDPTSTTSAPSTTRTSIPPQEMTWERIRVDALGLGDTDAQYMFHAVVTGGAGLIAAGQIRPASDFFDWYPVAGGVAAFWRSEDGETWIRIPYEESGPGTGAIVHDLTVGGPGLVAVGAVTSATQPTLDSSKLQAAVWVSEDGSSWERVVSPTFDHDIMYAAASGEPGVVAVGEQDIWFSPDGLDWQTVEGVNHDGLIAVAYADWGFVAIGWEGGGLDFCPSGEAGQTEQPVAWSSPNGTDWQRIELHPLAGDEWGYMTPRAVATQGSQVVIAGNSATRCPSHLDAPPAFWTTTDGDTWKEHLVPSVPIAELSKPEARIYGLEITDEGIVAAGAWSRPGGGSRAAAWYSTDNGTTWHEALADPAFEVVRSYPASGMEDLAQIRDHLVAVGSHGGKGAIWIGRWTN